MRFSKNENIQTHRETGSTLFMQEGLHVLRLYGTPYSRGTAHGRLLRSKILSSGISRYYGNYLVDLYRTSDFARLIPSFIKKQVGKLLEYWYYFPLERLLLPETREELFGLADAAGLDRSEVIRGYVAPDIMTHLAAAFLQGGEPVASYYLGGCSGAYARNSAMKQGSPAVFARNMDFPGVFVWKYPAVIFAYPEEETEILVEKSPDSWEWVTKKKQPYVYVSAAGFPGNGLTGMNSLGTCMSTFVCLSKNISRKGLLTLDFNHYLFTRAETVRGVLRLLSEKKLACATPHSVVFAGPDEAVSIEVDSKQIRPVSMPRGTDVHIQTNHFNDSKMKKNEFGFPLEEENTLGRYELLREVLTHNHGTLNPQKMADIISSNLDLRSGSCRLLGDFPAQPITLTSVLFEPSTRKFWVAGGTPPAVCYNGYIGFSFDDKNGRRFPGLFSGTPGPINRSASPLLPGTEPPAVSRTMKDSLKYCMLSQEALKMGKINSALRNIEKAVSLYGDPSYEYIRMILLLKKNDPETALAICEKLLPANIFPPA
ncbi:MAG: hypothetical protein E4H36_06760, partial [Spirochaetales bacterium]